MGPQRPRYGCCGLLELVAGIAIAPSGFGWVELDEPVEVLSLVGLAFLLFLAGFEIDFERRRGRMLGVTGIGFVASLGIGLLAALAFEGLGQSSGRSCARDATLHMLARAGPPPRATAEATRERD